MADRDDPRPPRPSGEEVASKVTSIADRVRRRETQRALEKARQALGDHTWTSESKVELAEHAAFLEQLDLDDALPDGADAEAREGRATLLCARANRAHLRGDAEGAFADWARAIEAAPHLADPYILRGAVRGARGETDAALADLDRATELAPNNPSAYYRRGEVFAILGDHERALANYRRGQQLAPTLLSNLSAMATSFLALGDVRGALGALDRAIRAAPHYADLFLRRAMCHAGLDNQDAALRDYDKSLDLNPRQPDVLRLRSCLLQSRGLHDQAIADLERACELEPDEVENHNALGWARLMASPANATIDDLTALIERNPDHDILYGLRGQAHQRAKHFEAALADFETASRLDPTCIPYVVGLSATRCELDGPQASLLYLDRMISLSPTDARLWAARGRVRAKEGKLEEALGDFDTAVSLDPNTASVHGERANVLNSMDDAEGAADCMTRAIELEPSDGAHYAWRGYYRIPLDDLRDDVGADFDRGVELSPEVAVTWFYRALFLETEERWTEALEDLEKSIAIQPTWGVLFYRRGTCRRGLAAKIIDECAEDWPTDEEERQSEDLTRAALADFDHCLDLGTRTWQVYEQLYYARGELHDEDGALEALDQAIALGAPGAWHYYLRSGMRRVRGDDAGARRDMATALEQGYRVSDEKEMAGLREYAAGAPGTGADA